MLIGVSERIPWVYHFYCSIYIGNQCMIAIRHLRGGLVYGQYNSNKAPQWFVLYGQYTTASGCIQAFLFALRVRTALSRGILAVYHNSSGLIA